MKLTIGMIVKNEEKWLDKCLSAIKPILDNVNSELIVTDTGSTDKTVEFAKKYTDKVLHFDWCDDFAAARNFGLEKAQGEWFMMLDADDIFRSCDNIIEFFNSGDYKKYNAASYISRNILKGENGDTYSDILAPRMVKLRPETKYENAVHESLNTFAPPFKNLQDIADHYGYYYETKEDKLKKYRRNEALLLKRLEKEKDTTPMLYLQLYETYYGIDEKDKALEYLNSGVILSKKLNSIVLAALYFYKAGYYYTDKKYDMAIQVCDEYFQMDKKIRPYPLNTDGEIYGIKAESLYNSGEYEQAINEFINFFKIYKEIENGKIHTYDSYLISNTMCSEISILPLFNDFIECSILAEKFDIADKYLSVFPFKKYSFDGKEIFRNAKLILDIIDKNNYEILETYYSQLSGHGKKIVADELFYRLQINDKYEEILSVISIIAAKDERINLKYLIYKSYLSGYDISIQLEIYTQKYGVNSDVDLIYIALKSKCDISVIFKSQEFDISKCVFLCCRNIDGFYAAAENYTPSCIKDVNYLDDAVRFYDCCISMRLMDNEDKTKEEKEELIRRLYKVKKDIIERKNNTSSEFEKLAITIKNNIRGFIKAGHFEAAKKTLDEYKMINPNDSEIPELLAKIK